MPKLSLEERILYEDNHLIILNKEPSEIVQSDKTGDAPVSEKLKSYLIEKYQKPGNAFLGVVHRLDRPVSGVIVFAKTSKALRRMNVLLQQRALKKTYWAIVKNQPPSDEQELIHYLERNAKNNKSYVFDRPAKNRKQAVLKYKLIAQSDDYYLLEIGLETGRHHQIRAQLSAIGCPIRGDLKYGYPRSNPDASVSLHARKVSFVHPVSKKKLEIIAPPPKETLWDYFVSVAGDK